MTSPAIERVIRALTGYRYQPLQMPFEVAKVQFDFAAAFIGPERTLDLVVVADTIAEPWSDLVREFSALARALDVADSRRTLTAILVGPKPDAATLGGLGSNCRVLPVGTAARDEEVDLRNWLSIFSPLQVPPPSAVIAVPLEELVRDHTQAVTEAHLARLVSAAQHSKEEVGRALVAVLKAVLAPPGEVGEE